LKTEEKKRKIMNIALNHIIKNLNLNTWVLEELEDESSEVSKHLSSLVLNFCLKSLDLEKRKVFVNMLKNKAEDEPAERACGKIWDYLKKNIPGFEKSLEKLILEKYE
jgi:undecaprenyl pyrophosphate synthase